MTTPPPPLALALGEEIYSRGFRFSSTPHEAVTYYLPRLTSGEPLHSVVRPVIHRADVHACSPAELARRFKPMPKTGDRFFFSPCKKKKAAAVSPAGCWTAQSTADIKDDGKGKGGGGEVVVGELRKLRYKKRGVFTDWLMDEYSSPACGGVDKQQKQEFVFCKVYVSPRAAPTSAAHHESAAFFSAPPPPATPAAVIAHPAVKRTTAPPPPHASMPLCAKRTAPQPRAVPPCAKRMRLGPVLQQPAPPAALTTPPLAADRKMCFAPPPQPCRSSPAAPSVTRTQPSPAPAPIQSAPAPIQSAPAPIQSALAPIQSAPAPIHSPPAPIQSAPAPIQSAPAPQVPRLPTRPVVHVQPRYSPMPAPPRPPKQQMPVPVPVPTPTMVRACHMPRQKLPPAPLCQLPPPQVCAVQSKQRSVLDPFQAAVRQQETEEQTVAAAAPDPPQMFPAADAPALQEHDCEDDLVKALEEAMSTAEAEEQTREEEDEDCWDDLAKELETQIQDEDKDEDQDCWDDLAKELELELEN